MFEKHLIEHAAPTLANLKSGSLFSYFYTDAVDLDGEIARQNENLAPKGITIRVLQRRARSALIYVYREKRLVQDLTHPIIRDLLAKQGYGECSVSCALDRLEHRIGTAAEFPHEIGAFLGYPPEDVRGFIRHRGKNCRCAGQWKVYGDVCAAQKLFAKYKKCTCAYCAQLARGRSVERLTVAG